MGRHGGTLFRWIGAVALSAATVVAVQAPGEDPAYVVRGRQTEARQRAFTERLQRLHAALSAALEEAAPDLLSQVEPPPSNVSGYRLLPRIVTDAPGASLDTPAKPQVVSYSWGWSDTLLARESANVKRLEDDLAKVTSAPSTAARTQFEAMVAGYKSAVRSRRRIEADIDYNWFWQREIARARPRFDRATGLIDAAVERQKRAEPMTGEILSGMGSVSLPAFVQIEQDGGHRWLITVPLTTDIEDGAFVRAFATAVESAWSGHSGQDWFRLRLEIETVSPERLYCTQAEDANPATAKCAPPAKGEKIDLAAHLARFPKDRAVLTTGAASLHVTGGRAVALGPHDVAPRVLSHEFGHLLGLPDGYLRGYRDLGADGFQVMELILQSADIMSAPGTGSVQGRHFDQLIAAKEVGTLMAAGLAALYQRNDPAEAAASFGEVLARNPAHYGATFQLAKALDKAGQADVALPVWKKILEMAEAAQDDETIGTARARLAAGGLSNRSPGAGS